ncbi:MAG: aldehyde dehydrogenase [Provencibacterium sp.]|nr:aldehyde dehydrogenase [Provencibacterium sp.]
MHLVEQQQKFFATGATLPVDYRVRQLRSLYQVILLNEERIAGALQKDLGKSDQEAYLTEIGLVLSEISFVLRHIGRWARPRRAPFSLATAFSSGSVRPEPYGVALILAPFNYPFQLALMPLISALAAGNCAVIKPSEYAPETAAILSEMLNNNFEQRLCAVETGGPETAKALLQEDFDYIFFTGGRSVGQQVYAAAAQNLVPVTLELGGKSPCIVEKTADLDAAAKRIVWGKFLNAGQTCVAPDYLLVQEPVHEELIARMREYILQFFGERPEKNPNYPRIVNEAHFERLQEMLGEGTVVAGGQTDPDTLRIAPTLLENAPFYSKVMSDEIFGPILPVVEFSTLEQAREYIALHEKPLALYLFTRSRAAEREILQRVPFGGGCVNDTMMHLSSHTLPFGGVGASGIGQYHGKAGFDAFSHFKSVLKKWPVLDIPMRYPPYGRAKPIMKRILK